MNGVEKPFWASGSVQLSRAELVRFSLIPSIFAVKPTTTTYIPENVGHTREAL